MQIRALFRALVGMEGCYQESLDHQYCNGVQRLHAAGRWVVRWKLLKKDVLREDFEASIYIHHAANAAKGLRSANCR